MTWRTFCEGRNHTWFVSECPTGCDTCELDADDKVVCTDGGCSDGYTDTYEDGERNGKCSKCSENCEECTSDADGQTCTECADDYIVDAEGTCSCKTQRNTSQKLLFWCSEKGVVIKYKDVIREGVNTKKDDDHTRAIRAISEND